MLMMSLWAPILPWLTSDPMASTMIRKACSDVVSETSYGGLTCSGGQGMRQVVEKGVRAFGTVFWQAREHQSIHHFTMFLKSGGAAQLNFLSSRSRCAVVYLNYT